MGSAQRLSRLSVLCRPCLCVRSCCTFRLKRELIGSAAVLGPRATGPATGIDYSFVWDPYAITPCQ